MQEKRKFFRYQIPLQVKFRTSKDKEKYSSGLTLNFSRQGLCFMSKDVTLSPEGIFELSIKHPQESKNIPVLGDIVWTKRVGSKCLTGIELREMDKEAKLDILDYAYDEWIEKKSTKK